MTDIAQKTVVVTGASSGIGEAIARRFAAAGSRLILAARRQDRLEALASSISTNCLCLELDVRDRGAVADAFGSLPEPYRNVDILINNAGLSRGLDKLHEGNPDGWEEMIDTNVKGLLYVSRAVLPGMVARESGHVINIGSIAGHEVYPSGNVYCASKHAVDALTRGLLLDLVDTPIRVSTVDPGLVETEFSRVRFYGDAERAERVYKGFQPLRGEDIAEAVYWVAERPAHVQVAQMIILPTAQGSAMVTHKK
ncbi:MAG: SDR family oxidoreductase [candidate division Zixibacteria bacterium]|nr:SDR family oxidoreductase [candidate division Zixibacteria bacterium]